jgi:peptide/nickel transport system permease protein
MSGGRLAGLVGRRLLVGLLTLWLVSVVIFFSAHLLPGDLAITILGTEATAQDLQTLREQLHLNEPVVVQYGRWLGGVLRGDFGNAIGGAVRNQNGQLIAGTPIIELVGPRMVNSLFLVGVAALVSIPLALLMAVISAAHHGGRVDSFLSSINLGLVAVPEFVIATGLIILFGTTVFKVLPAVSLLDPTVPIWLQPRAVILPAATLVLAVTPYISRMFRGSLIEVLESDYIQMAVLKGLPHRTVLWRHAVPNAVVPAIQVVALQIAILTSGVVIVEQVFQFNGIGSTLVSSVTGRDLPAVQLISLMIAAVYVVLNMLADISTILATPRLRTGGR